MEVKAKENIESSNTFKEINSSIGTGNENNTIDNPKDQAQTIVFMKKLLIISGVVVLVLIAGLVATTVIAVKHNDNNSISDLDLNALLGINPNDTIVTASNSTSESTTDLSNNTTSFRVSKYMEEFLTQFNDIASELENDENSDVIDDAEIGASSISYRTSSSSEKASSFESRLDKLRDSFLSDEAIDALDVPQEYKDNIKQFQSVYENFGSSTTTTIISKLAEKKSASRRRLAESQDECADDETSSFLEADNKYKNRNLYSLFTGIRWWRCAGRITTGCEYCMDPKWIKKYDSNCDQLGCLYDFKVNLCGCDYGLGCYHTHICFTFFKPFSWGHCIPRNISYIN